MLFRLAGTMDLNLEAKFAGNLFQRVDQGVRTWRRRIDEGSDQGVKERVIKFEEDLTNITYLVTMDTHVARILEKMNNTIFLKKLKQDGLFSFHKMLQFSELK